MAITTEIAKTKNIIEQAQSTQKWEETEKKIEDFFSKLKSNQQRLLSILKVYNLLRNYNQELFEKRDFQRITTLIVEMQNDINDKNPVSNKINLLVSAFEEIDQSLKNTWVNYIETSTREPLALLKIMKQILALSHPKVHDIGETILGIDQIRQKWHPAENDINQLNTLLTKPQSIIKDLEIEEDIKAFLISLAGGKVRLCDITQNIRQWLDKEKISQNLKITTVNIV